MHYYLIWLISHVNLASDMPKINAKMLNLGSGTEVLSQ